MAKPTTQRPAPAAHAVYREHRPPARIPDPWHAGTSAFPVPGCAWPSVRGKGRHIRPPLPPPWHSVGADRRPRVGPFHDIGDRFLDRFRGDAPGLVVGDLLVPAPVGLADGPLHGTGHLISVEYGLAVDVAGGTPDGLDQGAFGAQESLPCPHPVSPPARPRAYPAPRAAD